MDEARGERDSAGAGALRAVELALPVGFLAAALALAPATPLAVRASPAIHLALLVAGLLVLLRLERLAPAWDGWLAVAIGVAAEQCLVLTSGVPLGHDTRVHLWGAAAIADALRDGSSPLWLHRLGAGLPLLQFYPPLGFVPIVAAHLGGLPLHAAFRFAFVLFAAAGSLGVQRAVREWTGDRRAALVAAAAFAFAPYRLFDAHTRSALGETAALAVIAGCSPSPAPPSPSLTCSPWCLPPTACWPGGSPTWRAWDAQRGGVRWPPCRRCSRRPAAHWR